MGFGRNPPKTEANIEGGGGELKQPPDFFLPFHVFQYFVNIVFSKLLTTKSDNSLIFYVRGPIKQQLAI